MNTNLIETCKEDTFIRLCMDGNLTEIKDFYNKNNEINISAENDQAFRYVCFCAWQVNKSEIYLEIAKWLLSIPNNNINISACDDDAFKSACLYGYLNIAQWLLSIPNNNINISANDDQAFRDVCFQGHLDIAKWLLSLQDFNPNYRIDISEKGTDFFRWACIGNHINIVEWLISIPNNNIDFSVINNNILNYMYKQRCFEILHYLYNKKFIKLIDIENELIKNLLNKQTNTN